MEAQRNNSVVFNDLCDILGIEPKTAQKIGFKLQHLKDIVRIRQQVEQIKLSY